jgi:hypothetical protein
VNYTPCLSGRLASIFQVLAPLKLGAGLPDVSGLA